MKTKLERFVLGLILAPIFPLVGLMGFWWGTYLLSAENWIPFSMAAGLLTGILIDIIYLKRWVLRAYQVDLKLWGLVYLFYSVGFFGFFMGVPVFNVALAIPAGFIIGGRLNSLHYDQTQAHKMTRCAAWFTTGVMAAICIASAIIALADPFTEANLQGMLVLPFEVTRAMVVGLIIVGGLFLLISEWWLTILAVRFSSNFIQRIT
jgi:hypothetical protein